MSTSILMPGLRAVAERVTHRLVLRRRLPAAFRPTRLYVSTEGGLRYLRPSLASADRSLLSLVTEFVRPGAVVWDIGANVGLFSFAAASMAGSAGRVVAVEPDTWLVSLLRRSARVNGHTAPVEVLPAAVSDQLGLGNLHIARRARSTNHLTGFGTSQTGGIRGTERVLTVTLDWMLTQLPAPDLIKIDVEGAEALVLSGGSAVLAQRPALICEVSGPNRERVAELLRPLGYDFLDGEVPAARRQPLDRVPWALLAMPGAGSTRTAGSDRGVSCG